MKEEIIPKVFISYSHDNPVHKRWVAELASRLVKDGVDVFLDQWDIGLGDDIPKYMEMAVTESNRVLMICSEPYVLKANSGEGGVGYEAMIVTGEIVRDLGTSKFIPVIRQNTGSCLLPKSVSTRFYINLSEDQNFEEQYDILLRELHQIPAIAKPKIGKNPLARQPSGKEIPTEEITHDSDSKMIDDLTDISSIYKVALDTAREGDIVGWRRIIRLARKHIPDDLNKWRNTYEINFPKTDEEVKAMIMNGLSIYAPLFGISLAGVASGRNKFSNQASILDEIMYPKNWNLSGLTRVVSYPDTVAYFFQALHGAMCLFTDQLNLAINLLYTQIGYTSGRETAPLWQHHELMGWPSSIGNARLAWEILINLYESLPWLVELFGSEEEYQESICGYYMALNILEYVETIAAGHAEKLSTERLSLDIPVVFLRTDQDILRRAYRLVINDPEQVRDIWRKRKIEESEIKNYWDDWIKQCVSWISSSERDYIFAMRGEVIHKRLILDVMQ